MSDIDRINYNLDIAIANQDARHAAEDGRDLACEQCVEAMAVAISGAPFPSKRALTKAAAALAAAIASGYVIRP